MVDIKLSSLLTQLLLHQVNLLSILFYILIIRAI